MTFARGTVWCRSSNRFALSSDAKTLTPVTFPPGRLRLATRPNRTGWLIPAKTIGIVEVAALAASAETEEPQQLRKLSFGSNKLEAKYDVLEANRVRRPKR
jgi:hypothetical protein